MRLSWYSGSVGRLLDGGDRRSAEAIEEDPFVALRFVDLHLGRLGNIDETREQLCTNVGVQLRRV